jgi:hypothetical protein
MSIANVDKTISYFSWKLGEVILRIKSSAALLRFNPVDFIDESLKPSKRLTSKRSSGPNFSGLVNSFSSP